LCISCRDPTSFEQAVQFAEQQISKIHQEYVKFCSERGYTIPKLKEVKAICDHPHTSAPWHAAKFDHHQSQAAGAGGSKDTSGSRPGAGMNGTSGAGGPMGNGAMGGGGGGNNQFGGGNGVSNGYNTNSGNRNSGGPGAMDGFNAGGSISKGYGKGYGGMGKSGPSSYGYGAPGGPGS